MFSAAGATPTEERMLERVRDKVRERRAELTDLYEKHDLAEGWASKELDVEQLTARKRELAEAREELHLLEAEINLLKIKETHGLDLALAGMLIVFLGLASISLFIALLPRILTWRERASASTSPRAQPAPAAASARVHADELDEEILAALAMVLHAETERASGQNLKVTLGLNPSPWALSSQMRVIPGRIQS